jgi:hypothetical protein
MTVKKEFLVLTSLLGRDYKLKDPDIVFDSCDYMAIVDHDHLTSIWKQFSHYNFSSIDDYDSRRNAKLYKVLSTILFPDYKYIIWIDSNHQLIKDPIDIIKEYGESDLYLIPHPIRDCAYDEMTIVSGYLDSIDNITQQRAYYESKGFPKHNGLYMCGNFIRKNTPKMTIFELKWWEQICKFSSRDQCSFTYCLWDMEINNQTSIKINALNSPKESRLTQNKYFIAR